MRIRNLFGICVSLVLLFCIVGASADVITFAGIPWGSSAEEVSKALLESGYIEGMDAENLLYHTDSSKEYFVYTSVKFPGKDTSRYCPVSIYRDKEKQFSAVNLTSRRLRDYIGSGLYLDYPLDDLELYYVRDNDDVQLYGIMTIIRPDDVLAVFADLKEKLCALYGDCNTKPYQGGLFWDSAAWLGDDDTALLMGIFGQQENRYIMMYHMTLKCKDMLLAALENQ